MGQGNADGNKGKSNTKKKSKKVKKKKGKEDGKANGDTEKLNQNQDDVLQNAVEALKAIHGEEVIKEGLTKRQAGIRLYPFESHETCCCGRDHPPMPGFHQDPKACRFYNHIAQVLPFITLTRVLDTETKFLASDADCSGFVDMEEFSVIMKSNIGTVTKRQLERTFRETDVDENGMLDFIEVLMILDSLIQQESSLPENIKRNYSKVCVVQ